MNKQRLIVIGSWFLLLMGVRVFLGFVLHNVWLGTIGAATITFLIFYFCIRFTPLKKYSYIINNVFLDRYTKNYFLITGLILSILLGGILIFIEYGYSHYYSILIKLNIFDETETEQLLLQGNSGKPYSVYSITAILIASIDKSLNGNYSKLISYFLAEDVEMIILILILRKRKTLF